MIEFIIAALAIYGLTKIITETYIMRGFRSFFRAAAWEVMPGAMGRHMVRWFKTESGEDEAITTDEEHTTYDGREVQGYDMIACSFCVGFWIALIVWLTPMFPVWHLFALYGGASFLATQEP